MSKAEPAPWYPEGTDLNPLMPSMWDLGVSVRAGVAYSDANEHAGQEMFPNLDEVDEAIRQLRLAHDGATPAFDDARMPDDFMQPHLVLPAELWSDLLCVNSHWFFSRKLRDAIRAIA